MIKKIIIAVILLLLSSSNTYAVGVGGSCSATRDCDFGLKCDSPSGYTCTGFGGTQSCVANGPQFCVTTGANTACTKPNDCPNGYSCQPVAGGGKYCISTSNATSTGGSIAQAFFRNFQGGALPDSIGGFVSSILGQVYVIALILVLVYLTWGAYRYMLSGGDPKAVQAAKAHLTWAIIGMILVVLSFGIYQLLSSMLNALYS